MNLRGFLKNNTPLLVVAITIFLTLIVFFANAGILITALNYPINLANITDNTPSFNFTFTTEANSTLINCSLYANFTGGAWAINATNATTLVSGSVNQINFSGTGATDGSYLWNVICWANTTEGVIVNQTTNFTLFASNNTLAIDTVNPTLTTVLSPLNGTNISGRIPINATLGDATTGARLVYWRVINTLGTENYTNWRQLLNYKGTNFTGQWSNASAATGLNSSKLADGTYNISFNITDYAGLTGINKIRIFTVDNVAPASPTPVVGITNGNYSGNLTFNVTCTNLGSGIKNATLRIWKGNAGAAVTYSVDAMNNYKNTSGWEVSSWSTGINTSNTTFADGAYNITFNCSSYMTEQTALIVPINIDNILPAKAVSLSPTGGNNVSGRMNINATLIDPATGTGIRIAYYRVLYTKNATWVGNWVRMRGYKGTNFSGQWNSTLLTTDLVDGKGYNISFNYTDFAGNNNITISNNFTVDNVVPARPTLVTLATGMNLTGAHFINATFVDAFSGTTTVKYRIESNATSTNYTAWRFLKRQTGTAYSGQWNNRTAYNFSILADGGYNISFNITDGAGNNNISRFKVVVDDTAPVVKWGLFSRPTFTNTQIKRTNTTFNHTSGDSMKMNFNVTDATSTLRSINITIWHSGVRVGECALINSTATMKTSYNATCLYTPNMSGTYTVKATVMDNVTGGYNMRTNNEVGTFVVFNGVPKPTYVTGSAGSPIFRTTMVQNRVNYSVEMPYYYGGNNTLGSGEGAMPMFINNASFATATKMESLMFNYTFEVNFNASGAANPGYKINLTSTGIAPANVTTMTIYTPAGTKSITVGQPDFVGNIFTIYYYNSTGATRTSNVYQSNGVLSAAHPVNGSWDESHGIITLQFRNNSFNNTKRNFTLLVSTMPLVNITNQVITGFARDSPPQINSTTNTTGLTTTYNMTITGLNRYYGANAENFTVDIVFPKTVGAGPLNRTVLASNITVKIKVGTGNWRTLTNSTYMNATWLKKIKAGFKMTDAIPGSPFNGENINVNLSGYKLRLNLSQNNELGFKYGQVIRVYASANLNFSVMNTTIVNPNAQAGTTVVRNMTIMNGVKSGIKIPDSYLPGFSGGRQSIVVKLNGQTLSNTTQYSVGSITIDGTSLTSGANVVSISYKIPAATTTDTGGSTGGTVTSTNPVQSSTYVGIDAGEEAVVEFTDADLPVETVTIETTAYVSSTKITVEAMGTSAPSTATSAPTGNLYAYMQMSATNLGTSNLEKATVKFKVEKNWMTSNNYDKDKVSLNRLEGTTWTPYTATFASEDATNYYYTAEIPGFSYFAITAETATTTDDGTGDTGTGDTGTGDTGTGDEEPTTTAGFSLTWVIVAVVILLLAVGYFALKKRKHY